MGRLVRWVMLCQLTELCQTQLFVCLYKLKIYTDPWLWRANRIKLSLWPDLAKNRQACRPQLKSEGHTTSPVTQTDDQRWQMFRQGGRKRLPPLQTASRSHQTCQDPRQSRPKVWPLRNINRSYLCSFCRYFCKFCRYFWFLPARLV